ncbi:unnamed protein product [Cuscuta europaea]|uniref:Uncharacterized protein n=1 Tax=Cuscuta europaea TaxID=41803 RepID=A0A9P1DXT6_CUSEU|nr:unnamed protein product [Cuscuta europaea]
MLLPIKLLPGEAMDAKSFAKLKKQLAKESKKKEVSRQQRSVDEIFPKAGTPKVQKGEEPSRKTVVGDDAGSDARGSQVEGLKRKRTGKGVVPSEKKMMGLLRGRIPS